MLSIHSAVPPLPVRAANFNVGGTVQLAIRKMTIYTTSGASSTGEPNPHSADTSSSSTFLDQLSAINSGQYCLAHTFTYQDFTGGVLGLAYVGALSGVTHVGLVGDKALPSSLY